MEREVADNPEIVISHNNPPKGRKRKMKRRGGKRRRRLNAKLRVRFRGKLRTYKSLVKLKGRKFAKKKFRKSRKYHGRTLIGCPRVKHSSKRKHSTRKKHSKGRKRKGGGKKRRAHPKIVARGRAMAIVWKKHGAELKRIKSPRARMKKAQKFVKRYLKAA